MKTKSFGSFIGEILAHRGFRPDGKLRWRRDGPESTLFINLQRISFAPGFYINYEIAFNALAKGDSPAVDECIVGGRNPGLSENEKGKMLRLLDNSKELVASDILRAEFLELFHRQLEALERLGSLSGLRERLEQKPPLDMYVATALLDEIR
jgi:hypothetical protein